MRASISAPFVDTAADELIWTLTHPPIDPLATRTVSVAGTEVGLHVLGASHQVILRSGGNELVETVACLPGVGGDLPDSADRSSKAWEPIGSTPSWKLCLAPNFPAVWIISTARWPTPPADSSSPSSATHSQSQHCTCPPAMEGRFGGVPGTRTHRAANW